MPITVHIGIGCDKIAGSDFECTKCSPKGGGQEARSNADIQRLKSLDPGYKHAGMTIKWDGNGFRGKTRDIPKLLLIR